MLPVEVTMEKIKMHFFSKIFNNLLMKHITGIGARKCQQMAKRFFK